LGFWDTRYVTSSPPPPPHPPPPHHPPPPPTRRHTHMFQVHGGTTAADIAGKVQEAKLLALANREHHGPHIHTILFFDEANTSEAIGLIKEVMCDGTLAGQPLGLCDSLKFVAACNPYRK
jgi:hypothetical protein